MAIAFNIIIVCALLALLVIEERRFRKFRSTVQETQKSLAALSHRLRSPLATIRKYNEFLRSKDFGSLTLAQQEALSRMEGATRETLMLFQWLLSSSRIDEQEIAVRPSRVNVSESIQVAFHALAEKLEDKNHNVILPRASSLTVFIDPLHFHGMLDELLQNAIVYTEEEGSITVTAESKGSNAVIAVEDTGIGIPAEEKPRVFQKFFRGSRARAMSNGTGLGLAFAKKLAEEYGGTINFTSTEGQGSTFTLTLPKKQKKKK